MGPPKDTPLPQVYVNDVSVIAVSVLWSSFPMIGLQRYTSDNVRVDYPETTVKLGKPIHVGVVGNGEYKESRMGHRSSETDGGRNTGTRSFKC